MQRNCFLPNWLRMSFTSSPNGAEPISFTISIRTRLKNLNCNFQGEFVRCYGGRVRSECSSFNSFTTSSSSVFSSKSASAPWILDLLLDHIFNVLVHWSSEQQVVAEAVLLLTTFVDTRSKAAFVIQKSSKLWELTGIVCDPQTRKRFSATLPVQVQVNIGPYRLFSFCPPRSQSSISQTSHATSPLSPNILSVT